MDLAVTVLATGDPMYFGIGATLCRTFGVNELLVIPSPSGFSLAAARMGWPLAGVDCISLHGRAVAGLEPHILPGNRILSLTSVGRTVHEAASLLSARGYGASPVTVLEHMGGPNERAEALRADAVGEFNRDQPRFADFNMLAIECVASNTAAINNAVNPLSFLNMAGSPCRPGRIAQVYVEMTPLILCN